jgi:hypothetical protein
MTTNTIGHHRHRQGHSFGCVDVSDISPVFYIRTTANIYMLTHG